MGNKTIVVTGCNRGIGLEICRQLATLKHRVIATARDIDKLEKATEGIEGELDLYALDVGDSSSIKRFADDIKSKYPRIDVLINNAGIMGTDPIHWFNTDQLESVMNVNFYGPVKLTKALFDLIKNSDDGRVINISSGMGELESMQQGGYGAYRMSKWTLNGFTILLSSELKQQTRLKVVAMCPGWVKTDMGGDGAPRSVAQGADTAVWLATDQNVESGKFYRDRKVIPW